MPAGALNTGLRLTTLALLLSACSPLEPGAARSPTPSTSSATEVKEPALDLNGKREYVAQRSGKKLGEALLEFVQQPDGSVHESNHLVMEINTQDGLQRFVTDREVEYGPDLQELHSLSIDRERETETRLEITTTGRTIVVHSTEPGRDERRTLTAPEGLSSELAVFHALRREALRGKALPLERSYLQLDEEARDFEPARYRLLERTTLRGPEGEIQAWRFESFDESDDRATRGLVDDRGLPLELDLDGITIALRGTKAAETNGLLEVSSDIPVEGKLARSNKERSVSLVVDGAESHPKALIVDTPYQRVTRNGNTYSLVLSARRPTLKTAPSLPLSTLPDELKRYLAPNANSQSDATEIVVLADKIVGKQKDSRKAARAIAEWVFRNLQKADGVRGQASALETLAAMRGDCTEHSALVVALARASGIPARVASGIVLVPADKPGDKPGAGYHAWPELWLGEWVVMDAALGVFDTGSDYIFFEYDEPGEADSNALMMLAGKTKIVLPK
jgi:hypothetical protein